MRLTAEVSYWNENRIAKPS